MKRPKILDLKTDCKLTYHQARKCHKAHDPYIKYLETKNDCVCMDCGARIGNMPEYPNVECPYCRANRLRHQIKDKDQRIKELEDSVGELVEALQGVQSALPVRTKTIDELLAKHKKRWGDE